MKPAKAVCNYTLLQFLPYPEPGEFVNVGVLVTCMQTCLLHFHAETAMPDRVKAMFPRQREQALAEAMTAQQADMARAKGSVRDPKTCQMLFGELMRRRELTFRFGEVRTILTTDAKTLVDDFFTRYVRMETPKTAQALLATA